MRRLALPAIAAALLVAVPGIASGAKTVCSLVTDKENDANLGNPASPVHAPSHDIRSVDVATGAKTLVAVIRLTNANLASDPVATAGVTYELSFKIGDHAHRFFRRYGPNGQVVSDTATANGSPINGVVVKTDAKSISWTVPRGNVPKLKSRGAVITGFYAGSSSPTITYDQAPDGAVASTVKYVDRTPSCVKPA